MGPLGVEQIRRLSENLLSLEFAPLDGCVAHLVLDGEAHQGQTPNGGVRVLAVIPGDGTGFVFVERQLRSLVLVGVEIQKSYLQSRTSPRYLLQAWKRLNQEIQSSRAEILHAHYGTMTSFLCSLVRDVPVVITFRGSDLNPHSSFGRLRRYAGLFLSQLSVLGAAQVICVSAQLRDRLWWGRSRVILIPTGVDLGLFRPTTIEAARHVLGWSLSEKVVLFCAGREPHGKGCHLVRAAVDHAERSVGPIRLCVLDGSIDPDSVPQYLNAADCLAFASFQEGSPNIVKEAMACNLPVVSVDVGDVKERLLGLQHSKIVRRDPAEFGSALVEALTSRQRSNGREALLELSEETVASRLRLMYEQLLCRPRWRRR